MHANRCARLGCGNQPTHYVWGWFDFEGIQGWSLLEFCDPHFGEVLPGLEHAESSGHAVIDGPMPTQAPQP